MAAFFRRQAISSTLGYKFTVFMTKFSGAPITNISLDEKDCLYAVSSKDNSVRIVDAASFRVVSSVQGLKFGAKVNDIMAKIVVDPSTKLVGSLCPSSVFVLFHPMVVSLRVCRSGYRLSRWSEAPAELFCSIHTSVW